MVNYEEAVRVAAEDMSEAMEVMAVPDYVTVLVAGVLGDLYGVAHRKAVKDLDEGISAYRSPKSECVVCGKHIAGRGRYCSDVCRANDVFRRKRGLPANSEGWNRRKHNEVPDEIQRPRP